MSMQAFNKILYVEDDVDIQKIVTMTLEDIGGYKLKTCSSGTEALQAAEEFNPDLFLLDVMIPEMDGPSILKEIRKNPKFDNVPAIFISAEVLGHELIKYSDLGALGVIRKPFDPITLSKTISVLYQSSQKNTDNVEYILL
jgi:two-component system, OmpR family, response regulator